MVVVVVFSLVQALVGEIDERLVKLANSLVVVFGPPVIMLGVAQEDARNPDPCRSTPCSAFCASTCCWGCSSPRCTARSITLGGKAFFAQGVPATIPNCTYFSFTTLATIGYGDLTAATNLGHTLSVSEGLLGQVYLVTVVSLIVGNLGRRRPRERGLEG